MRVGSDIVDMYIMMQSIRAVLSAVLCGGVYCRKGLCMSNEITMKGGIP